MSYTDTYSLSKGDSLSLEREVNSVTVSTGKLLVTDGENDKGVAAGKTYDAKGSTTVAILAVEPSAFAVEFKVNPVVAPRPLLTDSEFEAVKDDREFADKQKADTKETEEASNPKSSSSKSATKAKKDRAAESKSDEKTAPKKG